MTIQREQKCKAIRVCAETMPQIPLSSKPGSHARLSDPKSVHPSNPCSPLRALHAFRLSAIPVSQASRAPTPGPMIQNPSIRAIRVLPSAPSAPSLFPRSSGSPSHRSPFQRRRETPKHETTKSHENPLSRPSLPFAPLVFPFVPFAPLRVIRVSNAPPPPQPPPPSTHTTDTRCGQSAGR